MHEGQYTIYRKDDHAHLIMETSSSGTCYHHPVVHVEQAEFRVDYGWYAHVQHDCHSSVLDIKNIVLPAVSRKNEARVARKSVQADYMLR